jgi:uncharacterized membrane protein YidH (DUF202 family)
MTDRGAQPERTALAWRRTSASVVVVVVLLVRDGWRGERPLLSFVAAAAAATLWSAALWCRGLRRPDRRDPAAAALGSSLAPVLASVVVTLLAVSALCVA